MSYKIVFNDELFHHGVQGQHWGVQNGPPYPLDRSISTGSRLKNAEKDSKEALKKEIVEKAAKIKSGDRVESFATGSNLEYRIKSKLFDDARNEIKKEADKLDEQKYLYFKEVEDTAHKALYEDYLTGVLDEFYTKADQKYDDDRDELDITLEILSEINPKINEVGKEYKKALVEYSHNMDEIVSDLVGECGDLQIAYIKSKGPFKKEAGITQYSKMLKSLLTYAANDIDNGGEGVDAFKVAYKDIHAFNPGFWADDIMRDVMKISGYTSMLTNDLKNYYYDGLKDTRR